MPMSSHEREGEKRLESWILRSLHLHFFVCAGHAHCLPVSELGFLWIGVESTTLLSAPLVFFNRSKHALEATWKYLMICSVGIAFALLGTSLSLQQANTELLLEGRFRYQSWWQ